MSARFARNGTLYEAGDAVRFVARVEGRFELVSIERSEELDVALEGGTERAIAERLVACDPEIDLPSAVDFVRELVASQALLPVKPATRTASASASASNDASPRLSDDASLAREIAGMLESLVRLGSPEGERLRRFRERFLERFDTRSVPLAIALDEDHGVGFDAVSPPAARWGAREHALLPLLVGASQRGEQQITLDPVQLRALLEHEAHETYDATRAHVAHVKVSPARAPHAGQLHVLRVCPKLDAETPGIVAEPTHAAREGRAGAVLGVITHVADHGEARALDRDDDGAEELPLADVLVSVEDVRVVLRSAACGCEIHVRAPIHVHEEERVEPPLDRFLRDLGGRSLACSASLWGALASSPFLPRVVCGPFVIAPGTTSAPVPEDALDILVATPASDRARAAPLRTAPCGPAVVARTFPPGSEWLYAKLYGSLPLLDRWLTNELPSLLDRLAQEERRGERGRWFFLRYADPKPHVRLRFHGDPSTLLQIVLPALHDAAAVAMQAGTIWKMQLDTYEREVERYGGPDAIALAEAIFCADSVAALAALAAVPSATREDRHAMALASVEQLLSDCGLSFADQRDIAAQCAGRAHASPRRAAPESGAVLPDEALAAFERRGHVTRPLLAELATRSRAAGIRSPRYVAAQLAHMTINRLLVVAPPDEERGLFAELVARYDARSRERM